MSFEIVEVLGSITFHNADIAIADSIVISDCEKLIGKQTDNKTFFITETHVTNKQLICCSSKLQLCIMFLCKGDYA